MHGPCTNSMLWLVADVAWPSPSNSLIWTQGLFLLIPARQQYSWTKPCCANCSSSGPCYTSYIGPRLGLHAALNGPLQI
ncbi:hypothetical protein VNO77_07240 [Canavalia gladiata]|uniref:Uncharacterized protein n=1 Tax=Canavalia gladiata TaxID=3824 RepID=A0AAN9M8Z5_CANGL